MPERRAKLIYGLSLLRRRDEKTHQQLTLCRIRRSSSDSSLVGRCIRAAASAGALAVAAAGACSVSGSAGAIVEQSRLECRRPHCSLPLSLPSSALRLCWCSPKLCPDADHDHSEAAPLYCRSSHTGLRPLQAMLCACECCSAQFMVRGKACSKSVPPRPLRDQGGQ